MKSVNIAIIYFSVIIIDAQKSALLAVSSTLDIDNYCNICGVTIIIVLILTFIYCAMGDSETIFCLCEIRIGC
jgi:hypothetical protein